MTVSNALPANLPNLAALFTNTYDTKTGGYIVAPRPVFARFSQDDVDKWKADKLVPKFDSIELEVAQFIYSLLRMTGAKTIFETGCSRGFSTCFLATAAHDNGGGSVITVDVEDIFHLWDRSALENSIQFINGSSVGVVDVVAELLSGDTFDVLFLDSLHTYRHLMLEIILYEKYLKVGGLIILHDTLYYDCLAPVVLAVDANPRFEVITLPSPRTHGRGTRPPGVTVIRKLNDDRISTPLFLSQEFVHWDSAEMKLQEFPDRKVGSEPMLNLLRKGRVTPV